jgi:3-oxoacyl-[acyl-carrier protein] reductase
MARIVVVSGGGTGMGRSMAERFAAAGDTVFVLGRRKEVLGRVAEDNPGMDIRPVQVDLTVAHEVLDVVDELSAGKIDVLVNNAGGLVKDEQPGLEGVFDAFRRTLDRNLMSAMMLTEALWPALRRPGGRVVNVSSIAAQRGGGDAYAAAKAGLVAWGFSLAARGGKDGITVNTVSPGYVQDTEFFNETGRSARHDRLVGETLLGRAGTPTDVASAVAFLASEEASWITGQILAVNGGALMGR